MKPLHLNRRLHLYLSLALLPWFLAYAVSSIIFSHNQYFDMRDRAAGVPLWTRVWERPYDVRVPEGDLRLLDRRIMEDAGLKRAFGVYRAGPDRSTCTYSISGGSNT